MEIKRILILLSIFFGIFSTANADYSDFVSGGESYNFFKAYTYTGTTISDTLYFTGTLYVKSIFCLNNNGLTNYSETVRFNILSNTFDWSFSDTWNKSHYLTLKDFWSKEISVQEFFSWSIMLSYRVSTDTLSSNPTYTGSYIANNCRINWVLFSNWKPDMQKIEIVKNIPLEVQDYWLSIINFLVILLIFLSPFIYFWFLVKEKRAKNALNSNPPKNEK